MTVRTLLLFLFLPSLIPLKAATPDQPDLLSPVSPKLVYKQSNDDSQRLNVYLDCDHCDRNFIREEIDMVSYVRDRKDANLHLLITRAGSAGGTEYTIQFLTINLSDVQNDTLNYFSPDTDSDDDERRGLVKNIKLGLVNYLKEYPASRHISIEYEAPEQESVDQSLQDDPWNRWLFEISGSARIDGRETNKNTHLDANFSAKRYTKTWKLDFFMGGNYRREKFDLDEGETTTHSNEQYYRGVTAYSLTDHWSVGMYTHANSSTYNNIDISADISPAIEYNIFPYSEYTEHELFFRYVISPNYRNYANETIYFKKSELLLREELLIEFNLNQPWGRIENRVRGSHFFHDFSFNRLDFNVELELDLFRGLSLDVYGNYSLINDQLSLPKKGATDRDVLLNLRDQATSYSYHAFVGLSYTFGTSFSSTVNPRL